MTNADKIIWFVYQTVFCRYGVPTKIVSDNRKQFGNAKFRRSCNDHKVQKGSLAIARLQTNGQVEAVNKTLKQNLKTRLESYKGVWPEKLLEVLWAYRTTIRTPTGETPFFLTFDHKVMVPVEIGVGSLRREEFQTDGNNERLREELVFLKEKCEQAMMRNTAYK